MTLIPRGDYGPDLFDDFLNGPFFTGVSEKDEEAKKLPVTRAGIVEKDGNCILEIKLPGLEEEDIKTEPKGGYLTVNAGITRSSGGKDDEGTPTHKKRYTNLCKRTFFIDEWIHQEDIKVGFENGVLKLQVPKDTSKVEETPECIDIP